MNRKKLIVIIIILASVALAWQKQRQGWPWQAQHASSDTASFELEGVRLGLQTKEVWDPKQKTIVQVFNRNNQEVATPITQLEFPGWTALKERNFKIIKLESGQIGFIFGWALLLTSDKGQTWTVWNPDSQLKSFICCNEYFIESVSMSAQGRGQIKVRLQPNELRERPFLISNDFGKNWYDE